METSKETQYPFEAILRPLGSLWLFLQGFRSLQISLGFVINSQHGSLHPTEDRPDDSLDVQQRKLKGTISKCEISAQIQCKQEQEGIMYELEAKALQDIDNFEALTISIELTPEVWRNGVVKGGIDFTFPGEAKLSV